MNKLKSVVLAIALSAGCYERGPVVDNDRSPLIALGEQCESSEHCDDGDSETFDMCVRFEPGFPGYCLSVPIDQPDPDPDPDPQPEPDPDPDPEECPPPPECPEPEPVECEDPEPECQGDGTGIVGQGGADSCETDCDCATGHVCIGANTGSGLCIETCIDDVCDEGFCNGFVNNGVPLCSAY